MANYFLQLKQILASLLAMLISFSPVPSSQLGATAPAQSKVPAFVEQLDRFEITKQSALEEGGENKIEVLKNEPKVILKKWNGEVALGVSYPKIQASASKKTLLGGVSGNNETIEYKDAKEEFHAYPLEPKEGMEDGGFEIEVILKEKPDTNVFDFTIDGAENLDFFYQSALTQAEIDEGASRPENVVGSYAMYHKTKANHRVGSINYAVGKFAHIYRPKAIDANGA